MTLAVCLLISTPATAGDRLTINTAFGQPISSPDNTGFFDRLMLEAFKRNGVEVIIHSPPAERALVNANSGIDDGDGPRVPDLNMDKAYPNLIRVPEKIFDLDFVAFTNGLNLSVTEWNSCVPYNVGIVRGWKVLERGIVQKQNLIKVRTPRILFRLLKSGRVDIALIDRWSGLAMATELDVQGVKIVGQPLARKEMYLYLHKKHKALIDKIANTLREMKEDGTYKRIMLETLEPATQDMVGAMK